MNVAIARLTKGSAIYGIGGTLQRFTSLLLLPFFTHELSTEEYGVFALISLLGVAVSGLFTLGTGNSLGVLYYREQDPVKRPTIIWSNTLLMALNGLLWYGVVYLAAPMLSVLMFQIDHYADLICLSLLGTVFLSIAKPLLMYLRMEEKAVSYVVLTLTGSLLTIGLSIWFVLVQRMGVTGLILASILSHGIMLLMNWLVIGSRLRFKIDVSLFRPLVRIGFPSIFGLFAYMIVDFADRQMIERIVGLDALGIYSVGYSFGMVMNVAIGAFATAWSPFFMSYIHKQEEAKTVFAKVLTYYLIGFGTLLVLFFFVAKPVVVLMTAPTFHEAYLVVGLVAAGYMFKGAYLVTLPGIYFAEKLYKQSILACLAAIVNICLNFWLIPIYGIVGAALATFFTYLSLPLAGWFVARRHLVVNYQCDRIAWTLVLMLITSSLLYCFSSSLDMNILMTVVVNTTTLLCYFIVAYRVLLNASERETIRARLRI